MDPIGKKLLEVAQKELGYREQGDGYTKYGDWYAKNVDSDSYFKTAPWCDMFLAWAANQAGLQDWVGEFAYTPDHAQWFDKQGAWGTDPQPGAIVFFSWSGGGGFDSIDHVGIVEKVEGDTLKTIEANTEGVYLKRKTRDVSSVVGYGFPSKVKVEGKTLESVTAPKPAAPKAYVPKHAAPPPAVSTIGSQQTAAPQKVTQHADPAPVVGQEAVIGGILAAAVVGTVALAVGRSTVARLPASPPVRVRKRGKHHRTPVALPVDMTPADLEAADASTATMPVISAAVAAEAEDREFWGRIEPLKEDQELEFWDSLHAALTDPAGTPAPSRSG